MPRRRRDCSFQLGLFTAIIGTNQDGEARYFQGAASLNSGVSDGTSVSRFEFGSEQAGNAFYTFPGVRESEPVVLLAINAVDGSIIDTVLGY